LRVLEITRRLRTMSWIAEMSKAEHRTLKPEELAALGSPDRQAVKMKERECGPTITQGTHLAHLRSRH
jgi:hypothetical protein